MTEWTLNGAFGAYLVTMALFGAWYLLPKPLLKTAAVGALVAGWGLHAFYIGARWLEGGRAPLSNQYESLVVVAWFVVLSHFLIFRRNFSSGMGFWSAGLAALILGVAALLDRGVRPLVPALQSNWLLYHVTTTLLGYAALGISFLAGAVYLVCARKEPSGEKALRLDDTVRRSMELGFVFLTIGVVLGAVWANEAWGTYWSWDPKETWSLITWLFYAVALHLRRTRAWRGKSFAWMATAGFAFVLFTYFGVNYLLSGLHAYA